MAINKIFAKSLAKRCWEKHATDFLLLDLKGKCDFCRYFMLMSGRNRFHLDSLRETAVDLAAEKGNKVYGVEGNPDSGWILIDFGDLILHIFQPEVREHYDLARLWGDAKMDAWDEAALFPKGRPAAKSVKPEKTATAEKPAKPKKCATAAKPAKPKKAAAAKTSKPRRKKGDS